MGKITVASPLLSPDILDVGRGQARIVSIKLGYQFSTSKNENYAIAQMP